jgi:phosphotriesterase-related protein
MAATRPRRRPRVGIRAPKNWRRARREQLGLEGRLLDENNKTAAAVCGPLPAAGLGLTSMSDHVMYDGAFLGRRLRGRMRAHSLPISEGDSVRLDNVGILQKNHVLAWDALRQDDETAMLDELVLFKNLGGQTILDLSVSQTRLDIAATARISRESGVNVVASTGFEASDAWPQALLELDAAGCARLMLDEIERGIGGTDAKAGHIYIGLSSLDPREESALRAAARVCSETGLSMTVKPCEGFGAARRALDILDEEGMDPGRVIVANIGLTSKPSFADAVREPELYRPDTSDAREALARGCTISAEFPNVMGLELADVYDAGDWAQISGLVSLISDGYCDQIVIGNGCAGKIGLHRSGGEGFCRLVYRAIPVLRDVAKISDYALRRITQENPARLLAR